MLQPLGQWKTQLQLFLNPRHPSSLVQVSLHSGSTLPQGMTHFSEDKKGITLSFMRYASCIKHSQTLKICSTELLSLQYKSKTKNYGTSHGSCHLHLAWVAFMGFTALCSAQQAMVPTAWFLGYRRCKVGLDHPCLDHPCVLMQAATGFKHKREKSEPIFPF